MSLSDYEIIMTESTKGVGHMEVLPTWKVREAVKKLIDNFCGEQHIGREINLKIIKEIFGSKLC